MTGPGRADDVGADDVIVMARRRPGLRRRARPDPLHPQLHSRAPNLT